MLGFGYDEENGKHKMKFCPPTSVRDKEGGTAPVKTQGKIDLRNESGRPMKVKVVGEVSEK